MVERKGKMNKAQEYFDTLVECDENNLEKAIELFNNIKSIYKDENSETVAEMMAKSLFNIAYYSFYVGDKEKAFSFLEELDVLAKCYPINQTIVWNLVYCYTNFISDLSQKYTAEKS